MVPDGLSLVGTNLDTGVSATLSGGRFAGGLPANSDDGRYMWTGQVATAWLRNGNGNMYKIVTHGSADPSQWTGLSGQGQWTEDRVVGDAGLLYNTDTQFLAAILFGTAQAPVLDDSNLLPTNTIPDGDQMVEVTGLGTNADGVILEGLNGSGAPLTIYRPTSFRRVDDPVGGGIDTTPLDQVIPIE